MRTIVIVLLAHVLLLATSALASAGKISSAILGDQQPSSTASASTTITAGTLAAAYFDLLDFMRSQAGGRSYGTSQTERQRVAVLLEQAWPQMDEQSRLSVLQIPDVWASLKTQWPTLTQAKQKELADYWKKLLLTPNFIYPPLANPNLYRSGDAISFQYPGSWTGGEAASGDVGYLFLGPGGNQTTWEQVMNPPTSPPGAYFILAPLTDELRSMTALQGAKLYAQQYVAGNVASMKEIHAAENAQGAMVVLSGRFPGQNEEKFFWVLIIPFGNQVIAGRLGGPVSQSNELVPNFWNMLSTLQLNLPTASGGVTGAWETAWSVVSTGIVKQIWAK